VRTLVNNVSQSAGAQSVAWDGKNDSSTVVADGKYTYRIDASDVAGSSTVQAATVVGDTTAPAVPTLDVQNDATGFSNTDNITSDLTPRFDGSTDSNAFVDLYIDNV